MVEKVLCKYRELCKKEKALTRKYHSYLETLKGIDYSKEKLFSKTKHITGNNDIESAIIKRDECMKEIKSIRRLKTSIEEIIEELKDCKNGEQVYKVIAMRYLEGKRYEDIKDDIDVEIATVYRRRKEGIRLLEELGIGSLSIECFEK